MLKIPLILTILLISQFVHSNQPADENRLSPSQDLLDLANRMGDSLLREAHVYGRHSNIQNDTNRTRLLASFQIEPLFRDKWEGFNRFNKNRLPLIKEELRQKMEGVEFFEEEAFGYVVYATDASSNPYYTRVIKLNIDIHYQDLESKGRLIRYLEEAGLSVKDLDPRAIKKSFVIGACPLFF